MFKRGIKLPFGADDNANTAEETNGTGGKDETKPGGKKPRKRKNADETNPEEPAGEGSVDGSKTDPDLSGNLDLEQLLADARESVNKGGKNG